MLDKGSVAPPWGSASEEEYVKAFATLTAISTGLTLALSIAPAHSATRDGVTLADSTQVGDKTLVLNGIGIREATIFNVNVYMAGLYLEKKTGDAAAIIKSDAPKRIIMHFVRDVGLDDITDAYQEGFKKNAKDKFASIKAQVEKWNSFMAEMKKGDRMTVTYLPGQGTTVNIRGKDQGTIAGHAFSQVLFRIFLGPKPPNKDLKEGMLGKRS